MNEDPPDKYTSSTADDVEEQELPDNTDHTFEVAPDHVEFPEEVTPAWDMSLTLEPDPPESPPTPWYENNYDRVLRVPYSRGKLFAILRLRRMVDDLGASRVGEMFVTNDWYCQRVRLP